MNMKHLAVFLLVTLAAIASAQAAAKPLKVFILAGQSNMQGHAKVSTFEHIGMDPATKPMLAEMLGADGKPKVCERVWISSIGYDAYSTAVAHFIRDVRKDLNAPKLPFVIGVLGVGGPTADYRPDQQRYKATHQNFRAALAAPAKLAKKADGSTATAA